MRDCQRVIGLFGLSSGAAAWMAIGAVGRSLVYRAAASLVRQHIPVWNPVERFCTCDYTAQLYTGGFLPEGVIGITRVEEVEAATQTALGVGREVRTKGCDGFYVGQDATCNSCSSATGGATVRTFEVTPVGKSGTRDATSETPKSTPGLGNFHLEALPPAVSS